MRRFNFNPIKIGLLIISLFFTQQSLAETTKIKPFVKGSFQQIQRDNKNSSYIVTFWSETCAFCMKELDLFGKLLKNYPGIKLISITTDPFLEEKTVNQILFSKNLPDVQKWVFAEAFAERLYFDVARNWRGELPLTYFADSQNKLVKHLGVIKEQELIDWLSLQSTSIAN